MKSGAKIQKLSDFAYLCNYCAFVFSICIKLKELIRKCLHSIPNNKTMMKKKILLAFGVIAAVSCVNKDYDLAKPVDLTMNVGGLLELPAPGESGYSYTLGEIILPDGSKADGTVRTQDDGSFLLVVEPTSGLNESYDFPTIEADDYSKSVEYPEYTYFISPGPGITWPDASQEIEVGIPFKLSVSGIDKSVEEIEEVSLDAVLSLSVGATKSGVKFVVKDGFTFTLPECMYVNEASLPSYAVLVENSGLRNKIRINEDRAADPTFSFECRLNRLDMGAFTLVEKSGGKEIIIDSDASATGTVEFQSSTLPIGTEFKLRTTAEISGIRAESVTLKASPVLEGKSQTIEFSGIPEVFTDGSLSFELEDILFYVTATNGTPFDFTVTSEISASSDEGRKNVEIAAEDGFTIEAGAVNRSFCLSESGRCGADTDRKIAVEGLCGLVSPVPDKILLSDTKAEGSSDGYVTLYASDSYDVGLSYRIEAPLTFKSLAIERDELVDINVDLGDDFGFDDLFIKAKFTSTLPLEAKLTFKLADSEGNEVDDITLKYEDEIGQLSVLSLPAGDLSAPVSENLKLVATAKEGTHISSIDKLKIHIEASSPAGRTVTLNEKQALSISDITVGTTSGVFVEIKN